MLEKGAGVWAVVTRTEGDASGVYAVCVVGILGMIGTSDVVAGVVTRMRGDASGAYAV